MSRAHNFSAGPAVLPVPVLEQLKDALLEFEGAQAGIMEISHRSADFGAVRYVVSVWIVVISVVPQPVSNAIPKAREQIC